MDKIRVAIIFGGKSAEHEVSLQSAKNVIEALDQEKFEPVLIGIDKMGRWYLNDQANYLLNSEDPKLISLNNSAKQITLSDDSSETKLIDLSNGKQEGSVDVVFPVLHGTNGEDGTMQGLLKLADIPFVGPSVLGSAIGMDKDVQKRLLRDAGIPVAKFVVYRGNASTSLSKEYQKIMDQLGLPFFVKPANAGSSVGVSKVENEDQFEKALDEAFKYDNKILIEEAIVGREIEVAVLGNEDPQASVPGEVIPVKDFYSYEAKYIDADGAKLKIPAELTQEQIKKLQETAIETYKTLCCEGMARVDMFLKPNGMVFVNEINTIPGFTKVSMYPKLWEASGLQYKDLINKLIELAIERFEKEKKLQTNFNTKNLK